MALGLLEGKTEAMHLAHNHSQPLSELSLPTLQATDEDSQIISINWTHQYRYLGHLLHYRLQNEEQINKSINKVDLLLKRYIKDLTIIDKASPALILELYKTLVIGANNYLLSIRKIDNTLCKMVNKCNKSIIARACGLNKQTPLALLHAEGRLLQFEEIWYREQIRLYLQLKFPSLHAQNNIATQLFNIISTHSNTKKVIHKSWFQMFTQNINAKIKKTTGIDITTLVGVTNTTTTASSIIRQYSIMKWQANAIKNITKRSTNDFTITIQSASITTRFIGGNTLQHICDLYHGYQQKCYISLDNVRVYNRMSTLGPTSTSAMLSNIAHITPKEVLQTLSKLKEGRTALFAFPVNIYIKQKLDEIEIPNIKHKIKKREIIDNLWHKIANGKETCPICNNHSSCNFNSDNIDKPLPVDLYHILFECKHPNMISQRLRMHHKATVLLPRIFGTTKKLIQTENSNNNQDDGSDIVAIFDNTFIGEDTYDNIPPDNDDENKNTLTVLFDKCGVAYINKIDTIINSTFDWLSDDGCYTLYRLLLLMPWGPEDIKQTPTNVPKALSDIFASYFEKQMSPTYLIRNTIHQWVTWSYDILHMMCNTWCELTSTIYTDIAQSHIPQAILEVEQRRRNTKTSTLKTKSKPTSTNNKNYSPDTSTTTAPDETDDDEYTSDGTTTTNTYDE
jgi:hypothetical protein